MKKVYAVLVLIVMVITIGCTSQEFINWSYYSLKIFSLVYGEAIFYAEGSPTLKENLKKAYAIYLLACKALEEYDATFIKSQKKEAELRDLLDRLDQIKSELDIQSFTIDENIETFPTPTREEIEALKNLIIRVD